MGSLAAIQASALRSILIDIVNYARAKSHIRDYIQTDFKSSLSIMAKTFLGNFGKKIFLMSTKEKDTSELVGEDT